MTLTSVEICAGAGGQARGIEMAGFEHAALVEIDRHACATLRANRPAWNVLEEDLLSWSGKEYAGVDLLAGGVPCPPFSSAGQQLGANDERDLFPTAIRLIGEIQPRAVMLENVRGLLDRRFDHYREHITEQIENLGYTVQWKLLNAADYGVPQARPRVICVALRHDVNATFEYPLPLDTPPATVGSTLLDLMAQNGWTGAQAWAEGAQAIAPTLVGGSKKHGGADLGPTRAKKAWAELGVDGKGLADAAPEASFEGMPRLTVRMAARIQGFEDSWELTGGKTAAYRQVGNALPPPLAHAVAQNIRRALEA